MATKNTTQNKVVKPTFKTKEVKPFEFDLEINKALHPMKITKTDFDKLNYILQVEENNIKADLVFMEMLRKQLPFEFDISTELITELAINMATYFYTPSK